ncbi:hypothetical protein BC739_003120 [Kutzneria viridogrisea]|uniref:DUF6884 domain-containing protein n=1 Tax=Kutzneria viridogrisea TaxID=47990 RepID=A0ABR6BGB3_9PSEU|nr:hypothetical protein [Kutzneria viridogrisea]
MDRVKLIPPIQGIRDMGAEVKLFIVPCGGAKLDHAAPARDLYTGSAFRQVLAAVRLEAEATALECAVTTRVMILSARYGLVDLDQVLSPYDVTMTSPDSITAAELAAQVAALVSEGGEWELFGFLPRAYLARLSAAVDLVNDWDVVTGWLLVHDVYEAAPGIGYQKQVAASLGKLAVVMPAPRRQVTVSRCSTVVRIRPVVRVRSQRPCSQQRGRSTRGRVRFRGAARRRGVP